jgi:hypothetical protein
MGKQFVTHETRVVSAAHCHNLREQNRDLQSLQTSVAASGACWGDLINEHGMIYAASCTVLWRFTNVMCVPTVHVSYCKCLLEWLVDPLQYFTTDDVWYNLSGYMTSQNSQYWACMISGPFFLWLLPTGSTAEKCFIITLAELEANAQAETVVIHDRELKSVATNFLRCAQQCLDVWGEHL